MASRSILGVPVGKILAAAGCLALVGMAAGCSSSATVVNHPSGASSGALAHVGDTLDLHSESGKAFQMTLTQVADPAQATNNAAAKNNKRFVAVLFHVTNTSSQTLAADGNADANLVGSNSHTYLPVHQSLKECDSHTTQFQLAPGKSGTSCVAFEVNSSVTISKVQFFPAAGAAKDYGEWLVP
jgi:hypothetical protein